MRKNVRECLEFIRCRTDFVPRAAIVLGSGLGGYADNLSNIKCRIPYEEIPGFPVSTVSGHAGEFVMGYVGNVPVVCMSGRVHYYEGYTPQEAVLPVRLMRAMGAEFLLLTNAAGGINEKYEPGTLVMIEDHVTLFVPNPLKADYDPEEGARFPDMTEVYDRGLREIIKKAAGEEGIRLESGVYCQLSGPSYETPAEIRLLRTLGVDIVGMSTGMEAIAAKHAGMRVCGISLVSNMAAGIKKEPLSHDEVKLAGAQSTPKFSRLVTAAVSALEGC